MVLFKYSTLVFFLFFANSAILAQENWEIVISGNNVIAEKNGEITHGDKLRFILSGKNCEVLEHVFTFYTVANNPQVENLKSRILTILDNGNEINSEVRFVLPFLAGHSVWFTMGKYYVEDHINFLKNVPSVEVEIVNGDNFTAKDYFDITENKWIVGGVELALIEAQDKCRQL